jgi:NAD(P)-dependent dehydrogenase (short-subunit alcohol dehydrogenase family)
MRRTMTGMLAGLMLCLTWAPAAEAVNATESAPTVLITGANRGLGFEFARQYAAGGWSVIATARKPEAATDLQALAKEYPGVTIEQLDVMDLDMIDGLADKYADRPIDVLLNNAGISGSPMPGQMFRKLDYDLFDDFMRTNAQGPLKMSEAFLRNVQNSRQKKIVVVSSTAGLFSKFDQGAKGTYFYRASKAALNMLMLQVADDVKRREITVIMLNPGLVDTQHILTELNEKMNLGLTLVPIEDSITGMRTIIDAKGLDDSGNIYQWSGERLEY